MSNYLQVLRQLEHDRGQTETPKQPTAKSTVTPLPATVPSAEVAIRTVDAPTGIATLFDSIRTLPSARPFRTVVFCGAAKTSGMTRVT